MTKAIKKTLFATGVIVGTILLMWLMCSFGEILSKNLNGGATYSDYNIIVNGINYYMSKTGGIF